MAGLVPTIPAREASTTAPTKRVRRDEPGDDISICMIVLIPSFQPARFLGQHDRYAVPDRVGELGLAGDQLLPFGIVFKRALGEGTDEDFQQFRIDAVGGPVGRRIGGYGEAPAIAPAL